MSTRETRNRSVIICYIALAIVASMALPSMLISRSSSPSSGPTIQPAPLIVVSASSNKPTCSPGALCPSQMQSAYGFNSLQESDITGKGQTIVIVDACGDPSIANDLKDFDGNFSLPNPTLKVLEIQGTPSSSCTGWTTEVALDVEWAHVTAPGAAIDLIVTANAGADAMYAGWSYALNHNLGNQISSSWGGAGCSIKPCNNNIGEGIGPCTLTNGTQGVNVSRILSSAKSKHVTVLAAAGDSGYWGLGTSNKEPVPGDCAGVLTVGGTQLSVSSTGAYMGETGWSGSGGGYITAPKEPSYQTDAKIKDPYGTLAKPDVSADASPSTGVWIYVDGGWEAIGGTSLATPLWAGFMADVNQIRSSNHFAPAGFVNSFLYTTIYGNPTLYSSDFHDVTTGSNGWSAGKGWDPVTGLGSFIAPSLANTLGNAGNA